MGRIACAVLAAALSGACSVYDAPAGGTGGASGAPGASGAAGAAGDGGASATGAGGDGDDAGDDASGMGGGVDGGDQGAGGTSGGGNGGTGGGVDASKEAAMDASFDNRDVSTDPTSEPPGDVIARPDGPGCAGFALSFDGFGYVSVNRPVQDDFTLEAWIKTTASPTGMSYPDGNGVFYADKGMNGNDFGSSVLNGKFAFGVGNGASSTAMTTILSTSDVTTGQWVHVAATRKMSTGVIQIFVNGMMESTGTVATQKNSLNAQPIMTIGGNTVDFHYFVGQIDEVRAWNVVRSATDIQQTMNKSLTGTETGLVGYWRFDEGAGAVAADATSTKNNGSVSGFATWVASDAPVCP
jgi:hypothetical protein